MFHFIISLILYRNLFLKFIARWFICGDDSGTLVCDSDIGKTERAIPKTTQGAREAAIVSLPSFSDFSSDEEMGEPERITLEDYGRLDKIDEVSQGSN